MVSEKLADRLIKDLPTMSTDELNLTIDMANGWSQQVPQAEDPAKAMATVQRFRRAVKAECERRNPKGTDGA